MTPFEFKTAPPLGEPVAQIASLSSPCSDCSVRQLTICAPLEERELAEMSAILSRLEVNPGSPLLFEGDPARHLFNVTTGAVKIYKTLADGRRQMTGFLFPGDFLGLANDETYAYGASAITKTWVCRFPRDKLEALLKRFPKMERRLFAMASHELAVAQEQMLLLGRKSAREKIASFLLMLSGRAVRRGQTDNPVSVPMTRADIGDYLGLTTETVSRTFTQLRQCGMITLLPGGKVQLIDSDRLEEIAEGA